MSTSVESIPVGVAGVPEGMIVPASVEPSPDDYVSIAVHQACLERNSALEREINHYNAALTASANSMQKQAKADWTPPKSSSVLTAENFVNSPCTCQQPGCVIVKRVVQNLLNEISALPQATNGHSRFLEMWVKTSQEALAKGIKEHDEKIDIVKKQEACINELKLKISRMSHQMQVLHEMKTDPHGRDKEVARLRKECEEIKQISDCRNEMLLRETKNFKNAHAQLQTLQETITANQFEIHKYKRENRLVAANEALLQAVPEDLKTLTFVGDCRDYVCARSRQQLTDRCTKLQREKDNNQVMLQAAENGRRKAVADAESWKQKTFAESAPAVKYVETAPVRVVARAVSQELSMKLNSLFDVSRGTTTAIEVSGLILDEGINILVDSLHRTESCTTCFSTTRNRRSGAMFKIWCTVHATRARQRRIRVARSGPASRRV